MCRRPLRSAGAASQVSDSVVVTHPFHPLCGQSLPVLFSKRRDGDVVFVCAGGVLGRVTVPRGWTDRGDPRSVDRLDVKSLSALDTLVKLLGQR